MRPSALMLALTLSALADSAVSASMESVSVQRLLQAARLWDGKDRPEIAREFLQKALLLEPDSPEALAMLGDIALRNGKPAEALRYQQRLEKSHPNSPLLSEMRDAYRIDTTEKGSLARMRLMARAGRIDEAQKILLKLYPGRPPRGEAAVEYYSIIGGASHGFDQARDGLNALYKETGDIRYRLALLNLMAGKPDMRAEAVKGFEELSKSSSVNVHKLQEFWRNSLYKLPYNTDTVSAIRRYLETFPGDRSMTDQIDTVQKNMLEQARADNESRNEERQPSDPHAAARTAALDALNRGDLDLAEKRLQALLKRSPADPEVIGGIGMVQFKRGNHAEAETWFARANAATPGGSRKWRGLTASARFWNNMRSAEKLLEDGRLTEADRLAQSALALQPGHPDVLALLGNIRLAEKDNAAAEALFRQALRQEGDNGNAMRGLVSLLSRTDRLEEAQALLAEHGQRYPEDGKKYVDVQVDLLRESADMDIAAGRPSRAVQSLEAAIILVPADPWTRFALARLYNSRGLSPLATQVMDDGIAAAPNNPSMRYARALVLISQASYLAALQDLDAIPDAEKTPSMKSAKVRAMLNLHIDEAKARLANGNASEAGHIMLAAEQIADAQQGLSAAEQVAEGWFSMSLPGRGLALMRRNMKPDTPIDDQIYYASLLNRAERDLELQPVLARLSKTVQAAPIGTMSSQELRLRQIGSDLQNRELRRLVDDGSIGRARQMVRDTADASATDDASRRALARRWMIVRQPDEALPLLIDLKKRDAADPEIRIELAEAYYAAREYGAARQEAAELQAMMRSDDLERRLRIVRLLIHIDDYQAARLLLDDLGRQYPDNPDVALQQGRLARVERDYDSAMRYFKLSESMSAVSWSQRQAERQAPEQLSLNLLPADQARQTANATKVQFNAIPETGGASVTLPEFPATGNDPLDRARQQVADVETRRQPRIETGFDRLSKTSSDGTSSYHGKEIPVVAWLPIGYNGHGFLHVDRVDIDAGRLPTDASGLADFGKFHAYQNALSDTQRGQLASSHPQDVSGTSVGVGYESDRLRFDIGVVGLGFPVTNLVGGFQKSGTLGRFNYGMDVSRRPQTSSLLSYAGTRDPVTGEKWGGVVDTSASARLSTNVNDYTLSGGLSYGVLTGKNVLANHHFGMRAGLDKDVYRSRSTVVNAGTTLSYARYAENESFYTFGHGGYYSPQKSLGLTFPLEIYGRLQRFSYLMRTSASYTRTHEKDMAVYPNDASLDARANRAVYTGGDGGGWGYAFRGVAEYRLTPTIAIGGSIQIDRSAYYNPRSLFVYIRYTFKPQNGETALRPGAVQPYSAF